MLFTLFYFKTLFSVTRKHTFIYYGIVKCSTKLFVYYSAVRSVPFTTHIMKILQKHTAQLINCLHGGELFLRCHWSLSCSGNSQSFMEPKVVLSRSLGPATGHILHRMNSVHFAMPYFFKIRFNIIIPPTPMSLNSLPFRFSKTQYAFLIASMHTTCPAYCIRLH
jgi:hypothetical protein